MLVHAPGLGLFRGKRASAPARTARPRYRRAIRRSC